MSYPIGAARAFQYGLVIFTLTALIGLANASKLFGDLSQDTLLTHLHSGTLGWITMGVIGVAIWMFGDTSRAAVRDVTITALATAAYVLAFWSGNFPARAIFGAIELIVILSWWYWAFSAASSEGLGHIDVPKLSLLLGLTTLVIGSTIGVILQVLFLTGNINQQNGALIGGHAGAQIGGYLILVAAGMAEWQLTGGGSRSRLGLAQAWLLFIGGLVLAVGIVVNVQPLLLLATLFQLAGIIIVIARFGRRAVGVPWIRATGLRHVGASVIFLVLGLILEIALVVKLGQANGDINGVPAGLNHALDHTMFVGLMTNALFGTILALNSPRLWPWADHVVFWGLNLGIASFVAVLVFVGTSSGAAAFSHPVAFTAPIMGLSALLGIVTFSLRLAGAPAATRAPAAA